MTYNEMRSVIISKLDDKCSNTLASLEEMSDYNLGWSCLMYKFLLDSGTRTESELQALSLDDYRNLIISLNASHTLWSSSALQGFANNKNLNIAYNWWFTQAVQQDQKSIN